MIVGFIVFSEHISTALHCMSVLFEICCARACVLVS